MILDSPISPPIDLIRWDFANIYFRAQILFQ